MNPLEESTSLSNGPPVAFAEKPTTVTDKDADSTTVACSTFSSDDRSPSSSPSSSGGQSQRSAHDSPILGQNYEPGTSVYRDFPGGGQFWGKIESFNSENGLYHIMYDVGTSEDLSHTDITAWVQKSANAATEDPHNAANASFTQKKPNARPPPVDTAARLSKRVRASTVIHVDGYAIKKINNYAVKGMKYHFGVVTEEQEEQKQHHNRKKTKQKAAPAAKKSIPRPKSTTEVARVALKHCLEQNVQAKRPLRQSFLAKHCEALEPFLEKKVVLQLRSWPKKDEAIKTEYMQPDAIQGDLRDYQLDGLNFMSEMYQRNIGMILGDGMYIALSRPAHLLVF
jgi:hypothetical protein